MSFRSAALRLLLVLPLLAGCLGFGGDGGPAADPEVRNDRAWAAYERDSGARITMRSEPGAVWATDARRLSGLVVRQSGDTGDGSESAAPGGVPVLAFDSCNRMQWDWAGDPNGTDAGSGPRFAQSRWIPGPTELVWWLAPGDLPHDAAAGTELLLPRGRIDLHAQRSGEGWRVEAASAGAEADGFDSERVVWQEAAPFPERVGPWRLVDWGNDGQPPVCVQEPDVAFYGWGRWGPEQDPPLSHSFSAMMEHALGDLTMVSLQLYLRDHPDAYMGQAIGVANPDYYGAASPDYHWQITVAYPEGASGRGFTCEVYAGDAETTPDVFVCRDGLLWFVDPPFPAVDFDSLQVADVTSFFDLARRWKPAQDLGFVMDINRGPNDDVLLFYDLSAFFDDTTPLSLAWIPDAPDIVIVEGVPLEEWLNPPEPST